MKYIVILADGSADYPVDALSGKTPLEAANKPMMDFFAQNGELFLVKTVPDHLKPGSDVANLSVMGYDPDKYYTGRSPLEAASIGVSLADDQTSFRTNLVTLSDEENYADKTMVDYSAGEITTAEADELIQAVDQAFHTDKISFYTGVSYRHLLVMTGAKESYRLTPPHDISDRKITNFLPDDEVLLSMMEKSWDVLSNHPVNQRRAARGLAVANSIWIWGEGKRPAISSFSEKYGIKGSVISAVDLIKGLGLLSGLRSIDVEGATGNVDTNFSGKAKACVKALLDDGDDFCYVHIEAPDECGHRGETENKIKSIELIDKEIIQYIVDKLKAANEDFRIMVLPDHPTPLSLKTHVSDPVPCVIYDSTKALAAKKRAMTEADARETGEVLSVGHRLMDRFLEK